jgi:pimeloyl-ACP methyl ester carboxylesterase
MNTRTIRHDCVTTRYVEMGEPDNPDVVLLVHDGWFGADGATLYAEVASRLGRHHRVLAPDMLGFGGTDKLVYFDRSMYAYRSAHLGGFVCALLGENSRVHAVGTSMGGSILLRDVVSDEPQVPVHSVVSMSGSGGPWRSKFGARELASYDGTEADIRRMLEHMADEFAGREEFVGARQCNTTMPGHVQALLAAAVKHPAAGPPPPAGAWPEPLASVEVPVTIVAGARDPLMEPGWEQHFAGLSELVRTETLEAKHAPSLDHAEEVVSIITDTVERAAANQGATS